MKRLSIIFLLTLAMMGVRADNFGLWSEIGLKQNLGVRGLSGSVDLGFRANNNMRNVDRWSAGFGLEYKLFKYLEAGASYSYLYGYTGSERKENYKKDGVTREGYNLTHGFWRSRNRFSFDLKSGFDLGRFSFSVRERYQLTGYNSVHVVKDRYRYIPIYGMDGEIEDWMNQEGYPEYGVPDIKERKSKEYLRSKFSVDYNIRHCKFQPSVSIELLNNLRGGFATDEVRYVVGGDWKFSKQVHLGAYYHYNDGRDADDDDEPHAIEISLKLKNIFFPAKK